LRRYIHHDGTQIDPNHLLDGRDEQEKSGTLDLPEAAEHEHDRALVFAQDAKRQHHEQHDKEHERAQTHADSHPHPP